MEIEGLVLGRHYARSERDLSKQNQAPVWAPDFFQHLSSLDGRCGDAGDDGARAWQVGVKSRFTRVQTGIECDAYLLADRRGS